MLAFLTIHPALATALLIASVAMFLAGLFAMPWIACRIPTDYFAREQRPAKPRNEQHPIVRATLLALKNLLGIVFILAGIAMLVLPGQGVLTILVGVVLTDLPGKYRIERWMIRLRCVHRPINWLRCKRGYEPLELNAPSERDFTNEEG